LPPCLLIIAVFIEAAGIAAERRERRACYAMIDAMQLHDA